MPLSPQNQVLKHLGADIRPATADKPIVPDITVGLGQAEAMVELWASGSTANRIIALDLADESRRRWEGRS